MSGTFVRKAGSNCGDRRQLENVQSVGGRASRREDLGSDLAEGARRDEHAKDKLTTKAGGKAYSAICSFNFHQKRS